MSSSPVFIITYWGATGTLSAPLKPRDVALKVQAALQFLAERELLGELGRAVGERRLGEFIATQLPFHLRSTYGGNTTCVEVQTPDALIILDCGSGFRELGVELSRRWRDPGFRGQREAHVIVTHPHMDHTFATPYFDPYYNAGNRFTLYASAAVIRSFEAVLSPVSPLSNMYFPPTFDLLKAIFQKWTIEGGQTFAIGATTVKTMNLHHPGGCLGFRLECGGRSFVFCTDHEHQQVPDSALADFARGADLLYLDGQYLQDELDGRAGIMGEAPLTRRGWGHSSVEACVATAVLAGVARLHVGHREPRRDDFDLARVERFAQDCLAEALRRAGRDPSACTVGLAVEGATIRL